MTPLSVVVADSHHVLLVLSVVVAICLVPLFGGRLRNLASLRFRWMPVLAIGALTQYLAISRLSHLPDGARASLEVGSYVAVLAFLIVNRHVPDLPILIAGGILNALVIIANGGVMPASAHALSQAGQLVHTSYFSNSSVVTNPHLLFLGDIFWLPSGFPLANVFSVGDVLIALGAFLTIHMAAGSRLAPGGRRTETHLSSNRAARR